MSIKFLGPMPNLRDFLTAVRKIRSEWPQEEKPKRKGDEQALWFGGSTSLLGVYRQSYTDLNLKKRTRAKSVRNSKAERCS